jgi:hypothetical protein
LTFLIPYIQQILTWLLGFVDWICIEFFKLVCAACVAVLAAIPVPAFFASAGSFAAGLPPGVLYYGQVIDLGFGFPILFTAIGLRFLIRRIPFIG